MVNFETLRRNSRGTHVELLQLGLTRAGYPVTLDGIFGPQTYSALLLFQAAEGLVQDGIAGPATWRALTPFLTGYIRHRIERGDTIYVLANTYGTTVSAIITANPGVNAQNLRIGQMLSVPLGFPVVPTNISFTSTVLALCIDGLTVRFPFLETETIGQSVMGADIVCLRIGQGTHTVQYNGSHHANEWITTPLLMQFLENYAGAYAENGTIYGENVRTLYNLSTLYLVPMVNPDGVDLATGELSSGPFYENARNMSAQYPGIPFPTGWKANIDGVDTNLQYPAGWDQAREIKFAQGFTRPGPRDYVGSAPLVAPESRAMYELTRRSDFWLTLSYHTQGEVIYWKYLDYEPHRSYEIARMFGEVSGYLVEETPYASGFAGYKDWFIQTYDRPGYTIEAGLGESPLPLSQFDQIYSDNLGILTLGLTANL